MENNVYTYYQTNEYMGMGFGYRTYDTASDAMDAVGKIGQCGQRITEVYEVTYVDRKFRCGKFSLYRREVLSRELIYSID